MEKKLKSLVVDLLGENKKLEKEITKLRQELNQKNQLIIEKDEKINCLEVLVEYYKEQLEEYSVVEETGGEKEEPETSNEPCMILKVEKLQSEEETEEIEAEQFSMFDTEEEEYAGRSIVDIEPVVRIRYRNKSAIKRQSDRPFECDFCGKMTRTKSNMIEHVQIHSDYKRYQCSVCLKKFRKNQQLKRHEAIHDDKKLFECSICGKSFKTKDGLKEHQQAHFGSTEDFSCQICGRIFKTKRTLSQHKKIIHLSEKIFECGKCGKKFKRNAQLTRHLSSVHQK